MTIPAARRTPIECGIARGLTDQQIADRLGEPVAVVAEVRAWLDDIATEDLFSLGNLDDATVFGDDEATIAAIMDGHITERGGSGNRPSPELLEAVRRLTAQGVLDAEIARRIKRTRDAVAKMRERHGIAPACAPVGERGLRHLWNAQARSHKAHTAVHRAARGSVQEPSLSVAT